MKYLFALIAVLIWTSGFTESMAKSRLEKMNQIYLEMEKFSFDAKDTSKLDDIHNDLEVLWAMNEESPDYSRKVNDALIKMDNFLIDKQFGFIKDRLQQIKSKH